MNSRRYALFFAGLAVMTLLVGCGDGRVEISGTVSVEGEPVEEGTIRFVPQGEDAVAVEGAAIVLGKYSARLTKGQKVVEVQGAKKVGEKQHDPDDPSSPMVPVMEPVVPPKYQRNSPLTATIDEPDEDLSFDLDRN